MSNKNKKEIPNPNLPLPTLKVLQCVLFCIFFFFNLSRSCGTTGSSSPLLQAGQSLLMQIGVLTRCCQHCSLHQYITALN